MVLLLRMIPCQGRRTENKKFGDDDMFAWKTAAWNLATGSDAPLPKLDARTSGMVAGTKVATASGWARIETINAGMQVLTFDGGLQTVVSVTRHVLMADTVDIASWPMAVPAGALGNREAMTILPHQPVMIESDLAEEMTGDPFALIPATALDGLRGITPTRPDAWIEVIQLHFARDEIVFANIGALFLCRAAADLTLTTPLDDYTVLPLELADDLVDYLAAEEMPAPHHAPMQQTVAA